MRQIGMVNDERQAKTLVDHLLTLGIKTRVNAEGDSFAVWVFDEDRVAQAAEELEAFQRSPTDPRFQAARDTARALRIKNEQLDRQYRKNVKDMAGLWGRVPLRRRPLTVALIAVAIVVFMGTHWGHDFRLQNLLLFSPLTFDEQGGIHDRGLANILRGELWRLVTPIFLHVNLMHLFFNMWWLRDLGTLIEAKRGTALLAVIVLLSAVASDFGQFAYMHTGSSTPGFFGGMSGVVYALFGYVWMKTEHEPWQGMVLHRTTVRIMLIWLVLCMTGVIGPVANAAHVVGLVVGMLFGLARF